MIRRLSLTAPGKTIIVSNRLPVTIERGEDGTISTNLSSGGLVSGLRQIHDKGESLWVGHCGVFTNESQFDDVVPSLDAKRLVPVPLRKKAYTAYYNGISNNAIWPLFHYFSAAMKFVPEEWRSYRAVNERFADTVLSLAEPGDRVWVHDYQLMLLPKMLRRARRQLRIAYFHHIPFPSSEMFRIIPHRDDILEGLLGAEYIGFHTYDYVRHFVSAVARVLGSDIHVDEVHHDNRLIKVAAHPLGINFSQFAAVDDETNLDLPQDKSTPATDPQKEPPKVASSAVRAVTGPPTDGVGHTDSDRPKVFLGIDRLDYTKGITERLMAFREFLRTNESYVGRVTLVQLCVPSRAEIQTYGNLKAAVERLVGQINGEFGLPGYTPVQYLYRSLPLQDVINLYRSSDVALVTPLRDGLNLVCKEYCAARVDDDGVLVLSEFAGAATEMGEAIKANPYDVQGLAMAMERAITMAPSERRRRMQLLRERVKENDNMTWATNFIEAWDRSHSSSEPRSQHLEGEMRTEVLDRLSSCRRLFLFLDHDGTLTPLAGRPELAIPSRDSRRLLERLQTVQNLNLTLVTGRPRDFCEEYFTNLGINVVAEHGAFIKEGAAESWHGQLGAEEFEDLKPELLKLLGMYARFVPGSHVEVKETSLVWHYRQAEPVFAESQAKELSESLQSMLGKTSLSVFGGKKTIEIRQVFANKGYAVEHFLEQGDFDENHDVMCTVGDDTTDEDMHRVHHDQNVSIHVGRPNIFAKYMLSSPTDVAAFLGELITRRSS